MNSHDFLWDVALNHTKESTDWIVPNEGIYEKTVYNSKTFTFGAGKEPMHEWTVMFREFFDAGVVSNVGGELWEAAILTCGLFIIEKDTLQKCSKVLELGSGVGVPGIFLAKHSDYFFSCDNRHIYLTDFDYDVLNNLCTTVALNASHDNCNRLNASETLVSVHNLDWFSIRHDESALLHFDAVDLVFGTALIYAPVHVAAADAIK